MACARRRRAAAPECGGVLTVALLAVPGGRWTQEFGRLVRSGRQARALLACALARGREALGRCAAWGAHSGQADVEAPGQIAVVGFVRMQAWRFMRALPQQEQSVTMMACLDSQHRRAGVLNFLSHDILGGMWLLTPVPVGDLEGSAASPYLPTASGQAAAAVPGIVWTRLPGQGPHFSHQVLARRFIEDAHAGLPAAEVVHVWPVMPELAVAMALGTWNIDITAVIRRRVGRPWVPPIMPPRAALRQFKRTRQFPVACVWQRAGRPGTRCRPGPGHLPGEPHDVDHLVAALAASHPLKSQGRVCLLYTSDAADE